MGMIETAAIVLAATAAATGTTYQIASSEDQARKAKNARAKAIKTAEEQQARLEAEEGRKAASANAAAYRQGRKSRAMYGSQDTQGTILGGGTIDANMQPGGTASGKTQLWA